MSAAVAYRDPRPYKDTEKAFPVVSRAWVLQERTLSRRNVYLGGDYLYWECCETENSELITETHNPYWLSLIFMSDLCKRFLYNGLRGKYGRDDDGHPLDDGWFRLVADFTSRDLSVSSDRIAAMAGMAEIIHASVDSPYLFGLWQRWPKYYLLWYNCANGLTLPRPKNRTVPTWSWMSIDGPVNFASGVAKGSKIEVIGFEVTTFTERQRIFGEVDKAVLRVKGILLQADGWEPRGRTRRHYTAQWKDCEPVEFMPDIALPPLEPLYFLVLDQRGSAIGLVLTMLGPENQFARVGYFHDHIMKRDRPWENGEERIVNIQ
jgi:hypothetical protein